jgi:hypothetical protein
MSVDARPAGGLLDHFAVRVRVFSIASQVPALVDFSVVLIPRGEGNGESCIIIESGKGGGKGGGASSSLTGLPSYQVD